MPAAAAMDQRKFRFRAAMEKGGDDDRRLRREHAVENFSAAPVMSLR
jgi:hypothetical protein